MSELLKVAPSSPRPLRIASFVRVFRPALLAGGVVGSLCAYGFLQERVMSQPYDGAMFEISTFLVLCNRLLALVFVVVVALCSPSGIHVLKPHVPAWRYASVSMFNFLSTTFQYEALKWVSMPAQVVGKTCKMLPVMLWSWVMTGKSHSKIDWVVASMVSAGIVFFVSCGDISAPTAGQSAGPTSAVVAPRPASGGMEGGNGGDLSAAGLGSAYGLLLLGMFVLTDSLTSTSQELLFKSTQMPKLNQMFYVNLFSCCISSLCLAYCDTGSGQNGFVAAWTFGIQHEDFLRDVFLLSVAAVFSQCCIFAVLQSLGALALASAMNFRQFCSIVISILMFGHPVAPLQVLGLALGFMGLGLKSCVASRLALMKQCTVPSCRKLELDSEAGIADDLIKTRG